MELKGKALRISICKSPVNFDWINVEFKAEF